jgi:hypothetical protein
MEEVGIEFFHYCGKEHLILVDRYSSYPLTAEMRATSTAATTKQLDS